MEKYTLQYEQIGQAGLNQVWKFFSDPRNLPLITPPGMKFKTLTSNLPDEIHDDLVIEYRVSPLMGYSTNWVSRIKKVKAPDFFIDEQQNGPYRLWIHEHRFKQVDGGILVSDKVTYALPVPFLGFLVNTFLIKPKLDSIFNFRRKKINELFNSFNHTQ